MKVRQTSDKEYVCSVLEKLKENEGYCPCSIVKTEDTKCMCKEFRKMIRRGEIGTCHCGLYETYLEDKNEK